ncbi:MAG: amidase [Dehalococcoidia bacterium]|nr:amidase [Dehalococcoidia bacterium]
MPSSDRELVFTPAWKLRDMIVKKKLSPVELTEACLRRIEKLDPKLNAFLTITADMARTEAKAAEKAMMKGGRLGPLHGIPVPIKDLEAVRGVKLTQGSLLHKDDVATVNAIAVDRIRAAGGIIIGKTNTPEWGLSGTNDNRLGDSCRNPWDPTRTSGGSSGGTGAAVASGMTPIGQGSDGGGSVRIPASLVGIYGIKATQGRVPRRQAAPHSFQPANFSSVGPMTRNVRDGAVFLKVLSGPQSDAEYGTLNEAVPDYESALGRGVRGLKIAWSPTLGGHLVDPEVKALCQKAVKVFEDAGAIIEDADFKPAPAGEQFQTWYNFFAARAWNTHPEAHDHLDQLTDYARSVLEDGRDMKSAELFLTYERIIQYQQYAREFFSKWDLLLSPTLAVAAFKINGHPATIGGKKAVHPKLGWLMTYPFNATGNPAATVPCGFNKDGMPVGLQITGAHCDEEVVIAASAAFEQAMPWADKLPKVS